MKFYLYIILFLFASCSEKNNFNKKKGSVTTTGKAEKNRLAKKAGKKRWLKKVAKMEHEY